jgi:hypothetical protein
MMRRLGLFFLLIFSISIYGQSKNVIASVNQFFEGMHAKDTLKMQLVCDKDLILQSIIENDFGSQLQNENASIFYKTVATIPAYIKFEEKLLDYQVMIDGSMAQVWTPYEFYLNGQISHFGVNCFTLQLDNNPRNPIWKIIHIIDTRRKK